MQTVVKFMGLIVLVAGVWHAKPLQAQQIDFYPANPWLVGSKQGESIQTSGAPHPNALPAPPIGFGGLFTVPQSLAMGQGIFDQDGVMDAIGAPGQGENHLGNCFGDLKSSVNLLAAALVPTCINGKCNNKCTEVPAVNLPPETKAICDKACSKAFPVSCVADCTEQSLLLKKNEMTICFKAVKKTFLGTYDACFNQCVVNADNVFNTCQNDCNNQPAPDLKKSCINQCTDDALNTISNCDQTCLSDKKSTDDALCIQTKLDGENQCLAGDCKDADNDGIPEWDDPKCQNCFNTVSQTETGCLTNSNKPFGILLDPAQCPPYFQDANIENSKCQTDKKCFDQPLMDYKVQCNAMNIESVDCLSLLSVEEVQQCVLMPQGEGGAKTLASGDIPESCKGEVQGAILQNDGDHDIADTLLEDKWGLDADSILVAEHIPDPVDSAFSTVSQKNQLFLPIAVTTGSFDPADTAPETVVLNAFPLNPDALSQVVAKMKSGDKNEQLEFLKQIAPMPLPSFLSDPKFQSKAPLFMFLRDGLAEPEYNFESECNTDKDKSPRNCLSTPVVVQPISSGSGADDLAILHQFFSTPTEDIDPKKALFGGWDQNPIGAMLKPLLTNLLSPSLLGKKSALDYCSNLTEEGLLPGQVPDNESSQAINVGYLGVGFNTMGGTSSGLKIVTPIVNEILGYTTLHTNDGQGNFSKWPSAGEPYRFCVGKTPVGMAKLGKTDLAVANFGGISSQDPLNPNISSMTFEVAGGVTFIHNYEGGKNKQEVVVNLPIRPAIDENQPLHPNSIACGDINADGYDDCIVTFMDAIGVHLNLVSQTAYRVPDVIATTKGLAPDFGGKCNNQDFPLPNDPKPWVCPDAKGVASYQDLANFNDKKWSCSKVTAPKNPVNPGDDGSSNTYDLYQCQGTANDPTCGFPFFKKFASSFVYKVNYKATYPQPVNVVPGQAIKTSGFPPQGWNCTQDAADLKNPGVFSWQCSLPESINLANALKSWKCSYTDKPLILNDPAQNKDPAVVETIQQNGLTYTETDVNSGVFVAPADGLPDGDLISCEGATTNQGNGMALALPAPLLSAIIEFSDDTTKQKIGTIAYQGPVQRDAVYTCNSGVPINRNSAFAIYMNRGAGVPFTQQFSNDPVFHQYVDVAGDNVPPIVADFPVDLASESSPTLLNKDKMSVTNKIFAKGSDPSKTGNFLGLGAWPSHGTLADLVDSAGAPKPDGCADAIIALNNSFHVAILPSQACKPVKGQPGKYEQDKNIKQPFAGKLIPFDSTTPKFKHDMAEFIKGPLQKMKDGQPLDAADKLILGIAMMSGPSYVTVPEQPLTGQREFSDLPPQRGIVVINGFPWRHLLTSMNSAEFPASMIEGMMKSLGNTFKGLFGAMGGLPGGGVAGCAKLPGGGGNGGCTLIPAAVSEAQCPRGGS